MAGRAPPLPLVRIGLGGGRRPPFLPPSLPLPSLLVQLGKGGNPTPGGSRTPPGRAIEGRPSPLLHSFIFVGGGTP